MPTLNELEGEFLAIEGYLENNFGELTPELEERLNITYDALKTKLDQYCWAIKRLENEENFQKQWADEHIKKARTCKKTREYLKDKIKSVMNTMGQDKLNGERYKLTVSKPRPKLSIFDESLIPKSLKTESIIYQPRKDDILRLFTEGKEIPGCKLDNSYTLRIGVKSYSGENKDGWKHRETSRTVEMSSL